MYVVNTVIQSFQKTWVVSQLAQQINIQWC